MAEQQDITRRALLAAAGAVGWGTMAMAPVRAQESEETSKETSDHVPITIFIRGKQELQLTGQKPIPGGFRWNAESKNPEIAEATVKPVGEPVFQFWNLTILGKKIGKTQVQVKEQQAFSSAPQTLFHGGCDSARAAGVGRLLRRARATRGRCG